MKLCSRITETRHGTPNQNKADRVHDESNSVEELIQNNKLRPPMKKPTSWPQLYIFSFVAFTFFFENNKVVLELVFDPN